MYIFITYGVPGWRGVQERGVALAKNFKENEVLFWNGYDSNFIKKFGFACKTFNPSLIDPRKIKFPPKTKAVVFADLPSNELFIFSVFCAAIQRNIPIVIFDQIYRRNQLKEGVYKNFAENSDLLILNGLNFFKKEETKKIKIIPPLATYKSRIGIKKTLASKYNLNSNDIWIFVSGYFKPVTKMVKSAYYMISKKINKFSLIVCGLPIKKSVKIGNRLFLPYLPQKEYLEFLDASDIFICKFGYLQILEALALSKVVIVAGEGGYVLKMNILDKKLQEVIKYAENPNDLAQKILPLIENVKKLKKIKNKISELHNGSFGGAEIAATYIKEVKPTKKRKIEKKILIVTNDELKKAEKLIKKESYLYVLGLITPISQPGPELHPIKRADKKILSKKIEELVPNSKEILSHSFKQIYIFSQRKYDGLVDIIPWYNSWIENINILLRTADKILVSPAIENFLYNLLLPFKNKVKTIII
jgi:glycosyltransferase involved in cell wall biosynthesis